jgi:carbon storage regulator
MLVLSRYKDESIMIGNDIEVMVLRVDGGKVRLGIKAPRDVAVHRKEIYLKIQEEKEWKTFTHNENR